MDKLVSRKTKSLKRLNDNPIHTKHQNSSKHKTIVSNTSRRELTNFYHHKKRTLNNDPSDDSSTKFLMDDFSLKNDSEFSTSIPNLPITWQVENTNIDCQMRIDCKLESNKPSEQDTNSLFKKSALKVDQMLHEIFNKLQFGKKLNDEDKKDKKDLGNINGIEFCNDFDDLFDDSWESKSNANDELNELEKKLSQKITTTDQSKESGLGSFLSADLNVKQNILPKVSDNSQNKQKIVDFKVPQTPAKCPIKLFTSNISNQFNSTPKVLSRKTTSIDRNLHFEDISPIKKEINNTLVNLNQESKRHLDESINQENSCKKRAKVLFAKPIKSKQQADEELMDDSFDVILSQISDKILVETNRSSFNSEINNETQSGKNNTQFINSKKISSENRQQKQNSYSICKATNNPNRNFICYKKSSIITPRLKSNLHIKSSESRIQFANDNSLFAEQKKIVDSNLNEDKKQKIDLINRFIDEDDLLIDDEADFICSQIH